MNSLFLNPAVRFGTAPNQRKAQDKQNQAIELALLESALSLGDWQYSLKELRKQQGKPGEAVVVKRLAQQIEELGERGGYYVERVQNLKQQASRLQEISRERDALIRELKELDELLVQEEEVGDTAAAGKTAVRQVQIQRALKALEEENGKLHHDYSQNEASLQYSVPDFALEAVREIEQAIDRIYPEDRPVPAVLHQALLKIKKSLAGALSTEVASLGLGVQKSLLARLQEVINRSR